MSLQAVDQGSIARRSDRYDQRADRHQPANSELAAVPAIERLHRRRRHRCAADAAGAARGFTAAVAQAARSARKTSSPCSPVDILASCRPRSSRWRASTLPTDLPLSFPPQSSSNGRTSSRREANMHAASAQIGVATANRLPNITLTAQRRKQCACDSARSSDPGRASGTSAQPCLRRFSTAERSSTSSVQREPLTSRQPSNIEAPSSPPSRMSPTRLSALKHDADTLKATAAAADAAKDQPRPRPTPI